MENVMLNSIQTQIKIVDFGLSNVWSADNPLRTHCGSPEYAAPELFVTGKQYGAEVDLWSLGIILYGMVLGQLPFVTTRTEYTTSQERRKKLVAQINKGLAAPHRRAIACFSSEFRHLMNRLLVADSTKRMAVKELIVHPWITDKGKRIIRTNPIKNLDSLWQAKIVTEIGTLIQSEPKLVMSAIAQDPLGKISGMFNMLIHKYQINQLKGDGVTRTLPSLTLMEQSDAHKNIRKESTCIKISTARSSQQRKAYTATATSRRPDYCTPRTAVDDNRNVKPDVNHNMIKNKHINIMANRKEDNSPKYRPSTIQIASNEKKCHMPDYRLIKTPTLRRKAYSANITPKTNRPFSPAPDEKRKQVDALPNKGGSPSPILANMSKKDHQLPVIGKRGISDALNAINRLPCNRATKQTFMQQHRNPPSRVRTANIDSRSKSDHLAGTKRPLTGPLKRTTERSIKHTSACPVTITQSACRTTDNRANVNTRTSARQKKEVLDRPQKLETSPLAFGDVAVRTSATTHKQGRKPVIYDPIARSIAGYVANNIPDQLNNFSWFKK